jgi:Sec-independent protein translocase protein TatA
VNFSISEIIVILLIALLVIKPEQLPDVAFTMGKFAKSLRRMFGKVKDEMNGLIDAVEKPEERKRDQQP